MALVWGRCSAHHVTYFDSYWGVLGLLGKPDVATAAPESAACKADGRALLSSARQNRAGSDRRQIYRVGVGSALRRLQQVPNEPCPTKKEPSG